jgi:DNA-3-methyladenine glycosylase
MSTRRPLSRSFYDRPVVVVAQELLGKKLVRETSTGILSGRIVEVEAYLAAGDSACHASRGMTKKNSAMFGPPGHAYVYPIHSRWCLNAVTEPEGTPSAVLIRAIEPLQGLEMMMAHRRTEKPLDLARGPGRLCEALGLDRAYNGWDLARGEELWIARDAKFRAASHQVLVSPRIGVTSAGELPLRFFLGGCRFVSGRRTLALGPSMSAAGPIVVGENSGARGNGEQGHFHHQHGKPVAIEKRNQR